MIKWICKPTGNCPVQADGYFLGYYFYFRARHQFATIDFCVSEERWDEDVIIASYTLKELKDSSAGWLSHKHCKWLIYKGCLRFLFKINKGGNK